MGKVSESCDVYSFGILVLEIVTGRKPIEKLPGGVKRTITECAKPLIMNGRFKDVVDLRLQGNFDENQLRQIINVATLCVQTEAERRPNMKQVLLSLTLLNHHDDQCPNAIPKLITSSSQSQIMRMESVKYGEKLLAQDTDDGGTGDSDDDDDSTTYGVFGATEVQGMPTEPRICRTWGS